MVVEFVNFGEKVDFYFNNGAIIPLYICIATISMFIAFAGTMLVETPFSKVAKMLMGLLLKGGKGKRTPENAESVLANGKESLVQSVDPSNS